MPYFATKDGVIRTAKLEFNLAAHCNFACEECSHFSPYLAPSLADYASFVRDLKALSKVFRAQRFRFVGGEPFLHKKILDYVEAVRGSGIASAIEVCSNGSLVNKVGDAVFRAIDKLSISWYPDDRCQEDKIDLARQKCREHNVQLKVERIERFRMMQLDVAITDDDLVDRIYRSCQIAHSWGCSTFLNGHFYLCSRPIFLGQYLAHNNPEHGHTSRTEGVALHESDLLGRLQAYLGRAEPLPSCRYCLGTVGQYRQWRSLTAEQRRHPAKQKRLAEDCIDHRRMDYLLTFSGLERTLLKFVPSIRLARALSVIKSLPIQGK